MKQIGIWHVGEMTGGRKRAFCRTPAACFSVTQPREGGALVVVRFECGEDVFQRILQTDDFEDRDTDEIKVLDAVEVPEGLFDALLA